MIVSQCCGAKLDPMFPNDTICNECKEHCDTFDDEELENDDVEEHYQFADSE